ncbi:MAG: ABC transporter ATP-binding protein [bacterium]|nr:ABC transporter ATP-binding protein [bacterium]
MLRLLPYYRRHLGPFWMGNGLLLVARIFEALIPQLLKQGIDGIGAGAPALGLLALGITACVLARFAAIWVGRRAVRKLGVEVAFDLRNRLYEHLQRMGQGFFTRYRTGDLMARAINDIGLVRRVVAQGTRTVLVLLFSSAVAFSFMIAESPSLTLLLIPPMPVIFGIAWLMSRRLYRESLAVQEGFSTLSDRVQENLGGIRTVQALGQEEREIARFAATNDDYLDRNLALVRTNSLLAALMPGLGATSVVAVLYFGGLRVQSGEISLGTFTAFVWYLNMVLWPVREAGNMINLFQRGAAGVARLFELLDTEPEIADRPQPGVPERIQGDIVLEGVTVGYPGAEVPTLRDVTLHVKPGETLAILGRIGSGKSTLLRLLVRLLEAPPGTIQLDGHDLRDYPLERLRGQVALVPQEPFLFSESIRENVSYDDPERSEEAVEAAAVASALAETLKGLPSGLETEVGERGVMLSGGQKQRVTLARALVRAAPVLLLDDPFSAVDAETETEILARLAPLRHDRTTIVVSHRVTAVRGADRIVVMEEGRIAEQGTHLELVQADGLYAALERTQRRRAQLEHELEEQEDALNEQEEEGQP